MSGLNYPTLGLFYYYLKEGLGITTDKISYFDSYWKELQNQYNPQENPNKNPIEYLIPDVNGQFDITVMRQNFGDSNCFYLSCSQDTVISLDSPEVITELKEKIKLPEPPKDNDLCLGYTWMICGWIDNYDDSNQLLAKSYYKNLTSKEWQHYRKGKFLGGRIIEAWRSNFEWEVPEPGSHVLIFLYLDEKAFAKALDESIVLIWMSLLLYRHKIWYSYQQSRNNKEKLRDNFNAITPHLEKHNQYTLERLRESLETNRKTLSMYSIDLNVIGIHQHSLNTNLDNYDVIVKQLIDQDNTGFLVNHYLRKNDLKFLDDFSEIAEMKYERQLEKDYATLAPGLAVLTGLTETIRGLVEVQQAEIDREQNKIMVQQTEIDREQNKIIAIAGLGLATSSAFAGIAATQVYQPNNDGKEIVPWVSIDTARIHWIQGLGFSLIPVAITLVIWLCMKKKR